LGESHLFEDEYGVSDALQDADPDFVSNYLDMFFASDDYTQGQNGDVFDRTAYFLDFGKQSEAINKMWISVKAGQGANDKIPTPVIVILGLVILGGVATLVIFKVKNKK